MKEFINVADFHYNLPEGRIAKFPVEPRDSSKLLFYKSGKIEHLKFNDLAKLLPNNATLVFNNTKVIPARLFFERESGAKIEVFLLNPVSENNSIETSMSSTSNCEWHCVVGNKKKWKEDEVLSLEIIVNNEKLDLNVKWKDKEKNEVTFFWKNGIVFSKLIDEFGAMPLPPYLNRAAEKEDHHHYQTSYSLHDGAVAAPTAGLHFTNKILDDLSTKGFNKVFLTLHVGAGTFLPVKVENAIEHPMHEEQIIFSIESIKQLLNNEGSIIPVGTTSMRSLESLYWFGVKLLKNKSSVFFIEKLFPYQKHDDISRDMSLQAVLEFMISNNLSTISGSTEIMIFEGYEFKVCNGIITNFHQPSSTLLLLVNALIGKDWRKVYEEALNNDYRFLSFGDSSLLLP